VAMVRRGPAEIKFDRKEMEYVAANLDLAALDAEIARVAPVMKAVGQDPEAAKAVILEALPKALPKVSESRFRFEFLTSPVQLFGDEKKMLTAVEVEDNTLVLKDSETKSRGAGSKRRLEVETVVFAIGDKVDETFGLPVEWNEFVKNPEPRYPMEGNSHEAYDPTAGRVIPDIFVAGWSRKASSGLVGIARRDGTNGAKAVWEYLQTLKPGTADRSALEARLKKLGKPVVTKAHLPKLYETEQAEAQKRGLEWFKFSTNEEMLKVMELA